jgi:putative protease
MAKEKEPKSIGVVSNYFDHVKVAAIKLTAPLKVGDTVEIKGGEVDVKQKIASMQIQHEKVDKAKKGDEIGIKVKGKVRKDYKVYLVK